MLHFFRKIRRDLLENSQFFKYLKYAVGEIVLVVLGILIALYINNQNQKRNDQKQEIVILRNIIEDINFDTLDLGNNLLYHKKFLKGEMELLSLLMNDNKIDSIDFNNALGTVLWTALHKSTFNNLQNNEIGLIKNNKLRKEISRFYDHYHQVIITTSNEHESFNLYKRKLPYFKKYFRVKKDKVQIMDVVEQQDYFEHNFSKGEIYLWDNNGARKDEEFKFTLNEIIFYRSALVSFHEEILLELKKLTGSIEMEIENINK